MSNTDVTQVTAVATPVSTEGVVLTTPGSPVNAPGNGGLYISGMLNITAGAGTTAVVVRVRQGSITGPIVGVAMTDTLAAAASESISVDVLDTSAFASTGSPVYVVTIQQTGGTGAGTVNICTIGVQVTQNTL